MSGDYEFYDAGKTKKQLTCIMNGCKVCPQRGYCSTHEKPDGQNAPGIPEHCGECGDWIYNAREQKGMFG